MEMEKTRDYIESNQENFIAELIEWLSIPSISALAEYAPDVERAAEWVAKRLEKLGFPQVELIAGQGYPLVYAEWQAEPEAPVVLLYGHYDVQPADPLDQWQGDPFKPRRIGDDLFARGASDDKGQVMILIGALEAWARCHGRLPITVKVLLEGEEECGGETVEQFVTNNRERLRCDVALICDTFMNGLNEPSLICGLRGILYAEVHVAGARSDLHSGSFGGVAPNPLHALCLLLSRLKGEEGRINIPQLYRKQTEVADVERSFWLRDADRFVQRLCTEMGVDELVGECEFGPHERLGIRPSLDVHGISGGFTGEGAKTVIPAEATAKVSIRLPAAVDPEEIFPFFMKAVQELMPKGYRTTVSKMHGGKGFEISPEHKVLSSAAEAIETVYGVAPVFMREGGSIPIASLFDITLQAPVVLMGFGLPNDRIHGPNEKISLTQLRRGMLTVAEFLGRLGDGI